MTLKEILQGKKSIKEMPLGYRIAIIVLLSLALLFANKSANFGSFITIVLILSFIWIVYPWLRNKKSK